MTNMFTACPKHGQPVLKRGPTFFETRSKHGKNLVKHAQGRVNASPELGQRINDRNTVQENSEHGVKTGRTTPPRTWSTYGQGGVNHVMTIFDHVSTIFGPHSDLETPVFWAWLTVC